jgi:hypothetical protein
MKLLWGDIHNHCSISYGKGTLQRALANAQQQLDFCSITGHAFWPDMPMDLAKFDDVVNMHLAGFTKLRHFWNEYLQQVNAANADEKFITFPSYEWHSMHYGDHNCYINTDLLPLLDAASPDELYQQLKQAGIDPILLPHHIGYARGYRGLNWDYFDAARSPLVEIYSNHGASEADDAPYEYHHSMGPRTGDSLARHGLLQGHRFGFYASTDSHDGYPGHYGHGRVGVWAEQHTRVGIWDALRARRTIASTGANIMMQMELGDAGIGQSTNRENSMPLRLNLEATSLLDKVEIIEGGAGQWKLHRLATPTTTSAFLPGRYKIRVEMGWGRKEFRSHWNVRSQIKNGELISCTPYFRYSGYNNSELEPTEKLLSQDAQCASWQATAVPNPSGAMGGTHFNASGTQSIVLEIKACEDSTLNIIFDQGELSCSIGDLRQQSIAKPVGGFGSPAIKIHRAIHESEYQLRSAQSFQPSFNGPGFIYARVLQNDGQTAWCSPIWFD